MEEIQLKPITETNLPAKN